MAMSQPTRRRGRLLDPGQIPAYKAIEPEQALLAAILRQAVLDTRQPLQAVEAVAFLRDAERLGWFCDLCGIELEAFQAHLGGLAP
jgi:hypothetical protein